MFQNQFFIKKNNPNVLESFLQNLILMFQNQFFIKM
jgi:hypothetical protein